MLQCQTDAVDSLSVAEHLTETILSNKNTAVTVTY